MMLRVRQHGGAEGMTRLCRIKTSMLLPSGKEKRAAPAWAGDLAFQHQERCHQAKPRRGNTLQRRKRLPGGRQALPFGAAGRIMPELFRVMQRSLLGMVVLLGAGCTSGPQGSAAVRVTPDGVRVAPVVSGRVGTVGVSVAP